MHILFSHKTNYYEIFVSEIVENLSVKDENIYIQDIEKEKYFSLNNSRKKEFLSVRKLLQNLFPSHNNQITYTQTGKPTCNNYHISISHSKSYVAVICSTKQPVSVDIEEFRPVIARTAPKFMSLHEQKHFTDIFSQTLVWSAKEVLYKLYEASANFTKDYSITQNEKKNQHGNLIGRVSTKKIDKTIKIQYFRTHNFILTWTFDSKQDI
ncbi:MAG: hypothetical protein R6U95_03180 [Bacteroidales bacterium]